MTISSNTDKQVKHSQRRCGVFFGRYKQTFKCVFKTFWPTKFQRSSTNLFSL